MDILFSQTKCMSSGQPAVLQRALMCIMKNETNFDYTLLHSAYRLTELLPYY